MGVEIGDAVWLRTTWNFNGMAKSILLLATLTSFLRAFIVATE